MNTNDASNYDELKYSARTLHVTQIQILNIIKKMKEYKVLIYSKKNSSNLYELTRARIFLTMTVLFELSSSIS